tara:strand:- start:11068 stop:11457 length:390 start_codon:yes stop_codon:yes gene_type:complete
MFKLFKSKQKPEDVDKKEELDTLEENAEVAITYYIKAGEKNPKIDVHIVDYEDETINKLSDLLCVLDSGQAMQVTLELVRDGLEDNDVAHKFISIATKLAMLRVSNRDMDKSEEDSGVEEPIIKPSDMM